MSTVITGNPAATYPASFTIPSDADPANAASVNVAFGALADRTAILGSNVSGVLDRRCRVSPHLAAYDGTYWDFLSRKLASKASSTGKAVIFPILLPHGAKLLNVRAELQGAAGHGALPAVMPSMIVESVSANGIDTTLATITDPSVNVATYELNHTVAAAADFAAGAGFTIANHTPSLAVPSFYQVIFTHESGANSIAAGLSLYSITLKYTLANAAVGF